jgi:hypothetical protein
MKKLTTVDYVVMIGGPALFMIIAVIGIRAMMVAGPDIDPAKALRDGAAVSGMNEKDVLRKVGSPKATIDNPDGSTTFRYQHGTWDLNRHTFVEEDAYVDFDVSGRVSGVSFEAKTPSQPK